MNQILLKKGREKPLLRRHPWVFSGAVASVQGDPQPGDTVEVETVLGRRVRGEVLSLNPGCRHGFGEPIQELIEAGLEARARIRDIAAAEEDREDS